MLKTDATIKPENTFRVNSPKVVTGQISYTNASSGKQTFNTGLTQCYSIVAIPQNTTSGGFYCGFLLDSISGGNVTFSGRDTNTGYYKNCNFYYIAVGE